MSRIPAARLRSRIAAAVGWSLGMVVALALFAGLASGALPRSVQAAGRQVGIVAPAAPSTLPADAFTLASPGETVVAPGPALPPIGTGEQADPDKVKAKIAEAGRTGGEIAAVVMDPHTGTELYADNGREALIPASTLKLLVAAAALESFGADHRFSTEVVAGPTAAGDSGPTSITVVGGGDPYLLGTGKRRGASGAEPTGQERGGGIAELAELTAKRLTDDGVDGVELTYDGSLFGGPDWHRSWPENYRSQVTPVSALWLDGGIAADGSRPTEPAAEAAKVFADELRKQGIEVDKVRQGTAPEGGESLAQVQSMPLRLIVERVVSFSDNNAAEVLLRHLGTIDGGDGSFGAGTQKLAEVLDALRIDLEGAELHDGSGLSRDNRLTALALVQTVSLGVDVDEFRSLLTGMSVAGAEGTLRQRFVEDGTLPGRGEVRAKTGTLMQVHTLAGYLVDDDGSVQVFAFMVNGDKPENDYDNRTWLEKMAAALAGCGCR